MSTYDERLASALYIHRDEIALLQQSGMTNAEARAFIEGAFQVLEREPRDIHACLDFECAVRAGRARAPGNASTRAKEE